MCIIKMCETVKEENWLLKTNKYIDEEVTKEDTKH